MPEPGSIDHIEDHTAVIPNPDWQQEQDWKYAHVYNGQAYTGYVQGWGITSFPMWEGTPYAIRIPVSRRWPPRQEILDDMAAITPDLLRTEDFKYFYRHLDMIPRFANPKTIASLLPTIMDRIDQDGNAFAHAVHNSKPINVKATNEGIYELRLAAMERCEEDPTIRFHKETVQRLFDEALHDHPQSLREAIIFDKRNRVIGESIDVAGKIKEVVLPQLLHPEEENQTAEQFLAWSHLDATLSAELLTYSMLQATTDEQVTHIIRKLAPVLGVERIRKQLRAYVDVNPSFRPKFHTAFAFMGFDKGQEVAIDLGRDVYAKATVDMSKDYEPYNETLPFELDLLAKEFEGLDQVVDVGCGNGRVMIPLGERTDAHLSGFDAFAPDIESIKAEHPEMDVKVGNWFEIPFSDKSFDAAYCMGRSFSHNTTIPDAVACLKEMARVIKDDGFVIMDTPNPRVGEYREFIAETHQRAVEIGLDRDILPWTINDSPDLEHFHDRTAWDQIAIKSLATLSGLKAQQLSEAKPYHGASGVENENLYWKLTKVENTRPLSISRKAGLIRDINEYRETYEPPQPSRFDLLTKPDQTTPALSLPPADDGSQSQ